MRRILNYLALPFLAWLLTAAMLYAEPVAKVNYDQQRDRLSVTGADVSLRELMQQVAAQAGLEITVTDAAEQQVTLELPPQPLEQGLKKLARQLQVSHVFLHRGNQGITRLVGMKILARNPDASGPTSTVGPEPADSERQPTAQQFVPGMTVEEKRQLVGDYLERERAERRRQVQQRQEDLEQHRQPPVRGRHLTAEERRRQFKEQHEARRAAKEPALSGAVGIAGRNRSPTGQSAAHAPGETAPDNPNQQ